MNMKTFVVLLFAVAATGCGTVGGAVSGAGTDLHNYGAIYVR